MIIEIQAKVITPKIFANRMLAVPMCPLRCSLATSIVAYSIHLPFWSRFCVKHVLDEFTNLNGDFHERINNGKQAFIQAFNILFYLVFIDRLATSHIALSFIV